MHGYGVVMGGLLTANTWNVAPLLQVAKLLTGVW